jgi:hypothetical protein
MSSGFDWKDDAGAIPLCSAAARTNGLNAEPGWRCACAARLNWLSRKFSPPTIATTLPSRGSIATSAAVGPSGFVSHFLIARPCRLLDVEVDARAHPVPTAEQTRRPVLVDELLLHVVREVRRDGGVDGRRSDVRRLRERHSHRREHVAARDLPLLEEVPEHEVPPLPGVPRVRDRVVARRVGRDPGEERGLGEGELRGAVAEVRQRGLLDAVRAVAEVDGVQVGGDDPVLVVLLLELPGERRLLDLAADRAVVPDHRVLDELLRDRRAALHDALVRDVLPGRRAMPRMSTPWCS